MDFAAHIRRLTSRLASTVTRGIITRVNDALATQNVQVELRFHDMADDVELFQPFGVSFHPPVDSEVLVLAVGSSQDNLVALTATSRADRPTGIQEGEGGLYTPSGWKVFLDAEGNVRLGSEGASIPLARADKVERELSLISTDLANLSGAGTTNPVLKYIEGSGSVGAEKVYGD